MAYYGCACVSAALCLRFTQHGYGFEPASSLLFFLRLLFRRFLHIAVAVIVSYFPFYSQCQQTSSFSTFFCSSFFFFVLQPSFFCSTGRTFPFSGLLAMKMPDNCDTEQSSMEVVSVWQVENRSWVSVTLNDCGNKFCPFCDFTDWFIIFLQMCLLFVDARFHCHRQR